VVVTLGAVAAPVSAAAHGRTPPAAHGLTVQAIRAGMTARVVQQSLPSQCFQGIGKPILPISATFTCTAGIPRNVSSYIWGATLSQDHKDLWFGEGTSMLCVNEAAYASAVAALGRTFPVPFYVRNQVACQFGKAVNPHFTGLFADATVPHVYEYDIARNTLIDRTPSPSVSPDFQKIGGIRAFGEMNNVAIAGGLEASIGDGQSSGGGVHLYAFNATTGQFLGSEIFDQYNNIKNFFTADGRMYVGFGLAKPLVGHCSCPSGVATGQVLQFVPSVSHPLPSVTHPPVVGNVGQTPSYFGFAGNRLLMTTYLNGGGQEAAGAVYVSPPLGPQGLTPGQANLWKKIFAPEQYFPDPITASQALGFGITEFKGDVYFVIGMYPGQSALSHILAYRGSFPFTFPALGHWFINSEPAAQVFRITGFETRHQKLQLLYGEKTFPVFVKPPGALRGHWQIQQNLMHLTPLYGGQGFGNRANPYGAWGIGVGGGRLYMGGFDTSHLFREVLLTEQSGFAQAILGHRVPAAELRLFSNAAFPDKSAAGPVWFFTNNHSPAQPLTTTGFGNQDNWGVRGIFPVSNTTVLFGTNNGFNFPAQGTSSPVPRRPGWQLVKLTTRP
jgi:hypothetical protein